MVSQLYKQYDELGHWPRYKYFNRDIIYEWLLRIPSCILLKKKKNSLDDGE